MPYDYDELLAALAPRPLLLHTPKEDRDATYADVAACIAKAAGAWSGGAAQLNHSVAEGKTTMGSKEVDTLVSWLAAVAKK